MRFCKNASLNLSINAIVVLILAITMLGLGLGFMKNIFGGATEEFKKVGGTVEKQMIDQMKESGKKIQLSRPSVDLKIGSKDQIFIGFKNDQNQPISYDITAEECTRLGEGNCGDLRLEYKTTPTEVGTGAVIVLPMNIVCPSVGCNEGTYFWLLTVDAGGESEKIELTVDVSV